MSKKTEKQLTGGLQFVQMSGIPKRTIGEDILYKEIFSDYSFYDSMISVGKEYSMIGRKAYKFASRLDSNRYFRGLPSPGQYESIGTSKDDILKYIDNQLTDYDVNTTSDALLHRKIYEQNTYITVYDTFDLYMFNKMYANDTDYDEPAFGDFVYKQNGYDYRWTDNYTDNSTHFTYKMQRDDASGKSDEFVYLNIDKVQVIDAVKYLFFKFEIDIDNDNSYSHQGCYIYKWNDNNGDITIDEGLTKQYSYYPIALLKTLGQEYTSAFTADEVKQTEKMAKLIGYDAKKGIGLFNGSEYQKQIDKLNQKIAHSSGQQQQDYITQRDNIQTNKDKAVSQYGDVDLIALTYALNPRRGYSPTTLAKSKFEVVAKYMFYHMMVWGGHDIDTVKNFNPDEVLQYTNSTMVFSKVKEYVKEKDYNVFYFSDAWQMENIADNNDNGLYDPIKSGYYITINPTPDNDADYYTETINILGTDVDVVFPGTKNGGVNGAYTMILDYYNPTIQRKLRMSIKNLLYCTKISKEDMDYYGGIFFGTRTKDGDYVDDALFRVPIIKEIVDVKIKLRGKKLLFKDSLCSSIIISKITETSTSWFSVFLIIVAIVIAVVAPYISPALAGSISIVTIIETIAISYALSFLTSIIDPELAFILTVAIMVFTAGGFAAFATQLISNPTQLVSLVSQASELYIRGQMKDLEHKQEDLDRRSKEANEHLRDVIKENEKDFDANYASSLTFERNQTEDDLDETVYTLMSPNTFFSIAKGQISYNFSILKNSNTEVLKEELKYKYLS